MRVGHQLDLRPNRLTRRPHSGDTILHRAVHHPDPHLHARKTRADIALQLCADIVHVSPATAGIALHPFAARPAQQLHYRHIQRFAQHIPQRHIDPADGRDQ